MKFDYLKQPNFSDPNQPWISRPIIPVRLSHEGKNIEVYALVDSGADLSLFHESIGRELGLEVRRGRPKKFFGISEGGGIEAFIHTIKLQVRGDSRVIEIDAGFTDSKGVGVILGQDGFFDHYQIRFERAKERIELIVAK